MAIPACAWHGNRKKYGKVVFLSIWLSHLIVVVSLWGRQYFTGEETEARDSELTKIIEIRSGAGSYLNLGLIISFITFPQNNDIIIIPCFLMGLLWKVKVHYKLYKNSQINVALLLYLLLYYQTIGTFLSVTSYRYQLVNAIHFKCNLSIILWQK